MAFKTHTGMSLLEPVWCRSLEALGDWQQVSAVVDSDLPPAGGDSDADGADSPANDSLLFTEQSSLLRCAFSRHSCLGCPTGTGTRSCASKEH